MTYQCPILVFKTCDGQHEHDDQEHSAMDESITGHKLHCPDCDQHLTSLLLCLKCGRRYAITHTRGRAVKQIKGSYGICE